MRRWMIVAISCALVLAIAPAAAAAPPGTTTAVSGAWTWVNTGAEFEDLPDGSVLITGTEVGTWTGGISGSSTDVFEMTQLPPADDPVHWGPGFGTLTASFVGTIGGKNGTATLFVTFWWAADDPQYHGTWEVVAGTKALKHVTGSGTWISSGVDASAIYTGTMTWK